MVWPNWIRPAAGERPVASGSHGRRWPVLLVLATLASVGVATPTEAQVVGGGGRPSEWSSTTPELAAIRSSEGWEVFWTLYLWAAGLEGEVGSRGRTTDVDLGFSDVVENLDGALMLPIELRKGRWGLLSELILLKLSDQSGTPGPLFGSVEVSADETLVHLLPFYRIVPQDPIAVDLLAGGRLWHLSAELDFTPGVLPGLIVEATERWVDPIIGMRVIADIGERWHVHGYGDLGGFGISSDLTWQLLGTIGYEIGEGTVLRFGYRHLDVDFVNEEDGFVFDAGTGGWVLGVTIRL